MTTEPVYTFTAPIDCLTSYSSMTSKLVYEPFEYYHRRGNKLFFRNKQERIIFNTDDYEKLKKGNVYHIQVESKPAPINDELATLLYSVE